MVSNLRLIERPTRICRGLKVHGNGPGLRTGQPYKVILPRRFVRGGLAAPRNTYNPSPVDEAYLLKVMHSDTSQLLKGMTCRHSDALPWLRLCIAIALTGALYAPVMAVMASEWAEFPSLSHGFAIPAIAAYLLWQRRARIASVQRTPSRTPP